MKKVLICTPMYNSQATAQYTISMIELMQLLSQEPDLAVTTLFALNESLIHKTRCMLAHAFLKSDATHLLFIDSDIGFSAKQLIKMMKTDEDFVCGIYPKKSIKWEYLAEAMADGFSVDTIQKGLLDYLYVPVADADESNDLIEIERSGTGMMLLSRKVFEDLADKVPEFKLENKVDNVSSFDEPIKEYFYTSIDPESKVYLHEDFNFCKLWKDNGGKIYAASWIELTHSGMHTYG